MSVRSTSTLLMMNGIRNTMCHSVIDAPISNEKCVTLSTTFIMIRFFDILSLLRFISTSTITRFISGSIVTLVMFIEWKYLKTEITCRGIVVTIWYVRTIVWIVFIFRIRFIFGFRFRFQFECSIWKSIKQDMKSQGKGPPQLPLQK